MHLEALRLERRLAQILERELGMAERREEIDQPEPVAAFPIGGREARVGLLQAFLDRVGQIGPGGLR